MKRRLKIAGGFILLLLVLGCLAVVAVSYREAITLIHNTDRTGPKETPAIYGLPYTNITLITRDHVRLAAWYIQSKNRAAVIVQHGYKDTRERMLFAAKVLSRHGYGVLLIDARAHGASEQNLITFGKNEVLDIRAGLDYLLQRPDVDPARIGALGNSQGAVTTLLATAKYPEIKAYVGNSPYVSLKDEIATGVHYFTGLPSFPFAPLIEQFAQQEADFQAEEVAPISHIAAIAPRPVLLMQGGRDQVIPTDSGQRLFDAARQPKELWFDPGVAHTNFDKDRQPEYEHRVIAFFNRYLLK